MRSPTRRTGRATPVDGRAGSTVASSATPREPTDGTRVLDRPRRNVAAVPTTTTASVSATRGCYRCRTRRPVGAHRRLTAAPADLQLLARVEDPVRVQHTLQGVLQLAHPRCELHVERCELLGADAVLAADGAAVLDGERHDPLVRGARDGRLGGVGGIVGDHRVQVAVADAAQLAVCLLY